MEYYDSSQSWLFWDWNSCSSNHVFLLYFGIHLQSINCDKDNVKSVSELQGNDYVLFEKETVYMQGEYYYFEFSIVIINLTFKEKIDNFKFENRKYKQDSFLKQMFWFQWVKHFYKAIPRIDQYSLLQDLSKIK